jgi:hypothetical protein
MTGHLDAGKLSGEAVQSVTAHDPAEHRLLGSLSCSIPATAPSGCSSRVNS